MKTISLIPIGVAAAALFAHTSFAQVFVPDTRPISATPPIDYSWAAIEIQSTAVTTKIRDQVAQTKVEQTLYNPNAQQTEGTLLFPVPRGAQLDKFTMEIDGKMVEAELLKSGKARGIYEEIVRKMKDPALLEYADRDLFKLRIFPIPGHGQKHISFSYTQVLKSDSGLVNYTFPLNTTRFSTRPLKNVSVKVKLESTKPLKSIYSPSHKVDVHRKGETRATVGFETADAKCDSDFELFYKSDSDELAANLMTYKTGDDDGYFLMLLSPGNIAKKHTVIPKDVTFVLDTSGSMDGNKIKQAKKALQFCVDNLNDEDHFEVIRFSTEVEPLFHQLRQVSDSSRKEAVDFIKDLQATGSTALDSALQESLKLRPKDSERPYLVIFLTDGLPTIGVTDEHTIIEHARKGGGNTRVFCFGVGYDVNTRLLDRIAEETRAVTQYVLPEEDIEAKVSSFFAKIKEPVLANPQLHFPDGVHVSKLYPSPLPDIFNGEQLVLVGRYQHSAHGQVVLEGTVNGATKKFRYNVDFSTDEEHDFIPRLWATRRVGYLLDEIRLHGENTESRDEVTALARKYGIVTPYTAYLIVEDEKKRNVPIVQRSLQNLDKDEVALRQGTVLYDGFSHNVTGEAAVANSQFNLSFKTANGANEAVTYANSLASHQAAGTVAYSMPALVSAAAPATTPVAPTPTEGNILAQVNQSAQQTRFVAGKNFFQNGTQWMDTEVQNASKAKHVRIQFNSKEYFELSRTNKQALPWLSQGNNVQFVMNGLVYEIYP